MQVVVAPIVSDANDYAIEVAEKAKALGLRVSTDLRNEKINYKVREHSLAKVPVILVVGKREAEEKKVSMRRLGSQDQTVLGLDEALKSSGGRSRAAGFAESGVGACGPGLRGDDGAEFCDQRPNMSSSALCRGSIAQQTPPRADQWILGTSPRMTELGRSAPGSMPVRGEFEIELVVILVDVLGRLPPVRAAGVALNGVDRRMAICVRLLIDRSHRGCAVHDWQRA